MSALPVVRVAGPLRDALGAPALESIGTAQLAAFLAQRRWFGSKGRVPTSVKFRDVVPLPFEGTIAAMSTIDVEMRGQHLRYSLPLAVIPGRHADDPARP